MAPEQTLDSRRSWIEMDKFRQKLQPGTQVFERSSRKSSVVRHPVQTVEVLEGRELAPSEIGTAAECRCGWPYTLLVPRGTPDGMQVRFMVLLTAGNDVHHAIHDPTNASYCGLRDSKYPDKRPMGYPFDRPFRGTVREWIDGESPPKQLVTATVQIVHTGKHYTQTAAPA